MADVPEDDEPQDAKELDLSAETPSARADSLRVVVTAPGGGVEADLTVREGLGTAVNYLVVVVGTISMLVAVTLLCRYAGAADGVTLGAAVTGFVATAFTGWWCVIRPNPTVRRHLLSDRKDGTR